MLPEFSIKNVKLKVSSDSASLIFAYIVFLTTIAWYVATRVWEHTNIIGLCLVAALDIMQFIFLRLPRTKKIEAFNSGGIVPIVVYNVTLVVTLIWYVPLYSPFLVTIPLIVFITVYYRGLITAILSSLEVIFIVVVGTYIQGLPHVPYAEYYPYIIIVLSIAYLGNISRAGHIENGTRIALSKAAARVSEEREQLSALINSMGDAVVATNLDGNLLFFNPAVQSLLGADTVNLGQNFFSIVRLLDDNDQPVDIFKQLHGTKGKMTVNNLHILQGNNEKTDLGIEIAPIQPSTDGAQEQGYIIIMRDITKQKTFDEEKDEFIAITSHELRTPIAIAEASMSLALVGKEKLPQSTRDNMEKAHKSVKLLAELTNSLITLSEVEKNRLELEISPVDVNETFHELESKYMKIAQSKGLRFISKVEPGIGAISTSKIYLKEILENYLSNALKYTQNGYVALDARLSTDKKSLILSVKDTGIGISKSDKPNIFGKFYQAENFSTRESGGSGLGLYVAMKLAQALGGKAWFESELKLGSTFYVSLKV